MMNKEIKRRMKEYNETYQEAKKKVEWYTTIEWDDITPLLDKVGYLGVEIKC